MSPGASLRAVNFHPLSPPLGMHLQYFTRSLLTECYDVRRRHAAMMVDQETIGFNSYVSSTIIGPCPLRPRPVIVMISRDVPAFAAEKIIDALLVSLQVGCILCTFRFHRALPTPGRSKRSYWTPNLRFSPSLSDRRARSCSSTASRSSRWVTSLRCNR